MLHSQRHKRLAGLKVARTYPTLRPVYLQLYNFTALQLYSFTALQLYNFITGVRLGDKRGWRQPEMGETAKNFDSPTRHAVKRNAQKYLGISPPSALHNEKMKIMKIMKTGKNEK